MSAMDQVKNEFNDRWRVWQKSDAARYRWRIWFAWYPMRIWQRQPGDMRSVVKWVWLQRVVQTKVRVTHSDNCSGRQLEGPACDCLPGRKSWRAYIENQGVAAESKWVKDDAR